MQILKQVASALCALILITVIGCGKKSNETDPVASLYSETQIVSNVVYAHPDSSALLLDAYVPCKRLGEPPWNEYSDERKPTLLFFHGGGWRTGDKISRSLFLMPYVAKKWCVVTANYRHLDETSLVGIVRDARSALNWIYENAAKYKFDTTKIIVSGESSGGHLALMTGLITDEAVFQQDNVKAGRKLKAAGIVNWFGVADLVKASAQWDSAYLNDVVPKASERDSIFRVASPINYVSKNRIPIMSIHGDQDKSAPYEQSVMLHAKLQSLNTKNVFLTIHGKKHGNFDAADMTMIHHEIWKFTKEIGVE